MKQSSNWSVSHQSIPSLFSNFPLQDVILSRPLCPLHEMLQNAPIRNPAACKRLCCIKYTKCCTNEWKSISYKRCHSNWDLGRLNPKMSVDFSPRFGTEFLSVSPTLAVFKKWILKNTWAGHLNLIVASVHISLQKTLQFLLSLQARVSGCLQKMPLPPSTDASIARFVDFRVPSHTHSTFNAAYNSSIV